MAANSQNDRAVIDLVINGQQAKTSLKEVSLAITATRSALNKMKEADDPASYRAKVAEMQKLTASYRQMQTVINGTTSAWSRFKANAASTATGLVGGNLITTAIQAAVGVIPAAIGKFREFDAASADMSANLGLAAKDVTYFNEQAKKMGPELGKSAAEVLDGFKLVGSANSDLIKTPELLADVTKKAITLSQASKMTLADATASLVGSMNQFDAGADQAGRFINVMAGGAQVGSAEIADMANALNASGIVANQTGLTFEQTNGALQSLSKESLKGEQAGTMLRNILLTLGAGANETNPRVVGLSTALENLAKKNMSTAQVTKLFGKENVTAALSLINHRDRVTEFTDGLTGTSAAYDMAAKNNATMDHQLELFTAQVDKAALWLGTKLVPAFTSVVKGATDFIIALPQMAGWLQKNGEWLLITGIPALIAYNGAMIKATLAAAANTLAEGYRRVAYQAGFAWLVISETATKAYALATGVLTGQISLQTAVVTIARNVWAAFSAVLLANPIGLVVAALGGLVAAAKYFSEHTKAALDVERQKQALQKQGVKNTQDSSKALSDLNTQVGQANLLSVTERENLQKTIALKQLEAKARLQNALAQAREIARAEGTKPTFWQGMKQGATDLVTGNWGNLGGAGLEQRKKEQAEANKAAAYEEAKQAANIDQLKADLSAMDGLMNKVKNPQTGNPGGGGGKGGLTDEQKKAAEKKKKEAAKEAQDLETMLADSRQRIMQGEKTEYENEVAAFAEKYTKMYELAKDNQAKIDEVSRLSLIEMDQIDKRRQEKEDEADRKQREKDNKEGFESAMKPADDQRSETFSTIDRTQALSPTATGEVEVQLQKLQADQVYYTQKLLLEQTFAQESADTQRQLTENWNQQVILRATTERQYAEQMKQAEWSLQDAKRSAMGQGVEVLKGFLTEGTIAYKAAMVAQKAFAIAQIVVDMNREVAQIYANPAWSLMPDGGLTLKTAMATAARVRAGIGIASVVASGIGELAQKADGGFTGMTELYGDPSGFTGGPTLFNQGRRSYIAGEAGREFVISNKALQNPVVANFARLMDSAQKTGNYGLLTSGASGGARAGSPAVTPSSAGISSTGMSQDMGMAILTQLQKSHLAMEAYANRPIVNNYRLTEQYAAELQQIRNENSLKSS